MARFFLSNVRRYLNRVFAALFFASLAHACQAQTNMTDFLLTRLAPSYPASIVYSPSNSAGPGAYWFTEFYGGAVGRIDLVSNVVTEVLLTNNAGAAVYGITTGPDGNLWFTEAYSERIARLNPATSNYVEFALSNNVNRYPATIISGPDKNLWFTEQAQNKLAAISTNAFTNSLGYLIPIQESPAIRTNTQLYGLTVGSDSNLWFTEASYGIIGRYNIASNSYTEFALPMTNCTPFSIVNGPDNALWFTEFNTNVIGRMTTDGRHLTEFHLPLLSGYPTPTPFGILNGPDGNIWFSEYNGSAIGRITPGGIVTLFPTCAVNSYPIFLATGADSNIWFTEYTSAYSSGSYDRIGRLIVAEALSLSAPASINVPAATLSSTLLATFQNSNGTNIVTVNWGDGTASSLLFTNSLNPTNFTASGLTTNLVVMTNSSRYTNYLTVSNTAPLGTNFSNGSFSVYASHTFPNFSNYFGNITVVDSSNDTAFASIAFHLSPLGIIRTGASVVLYWPTNATTVSLYQNPNLLTTNWTKVTNAVVKANGQNQVTFPISTSTTEFFRLQ